MMTSSIDIADLLIHLDTLYDDHPMDTLTRHNPYWVLVACVLSLRNKDETTIPAATRLFALADTPQAMVALTPEAIQEAIYPVCFYRNKSHSILDFSQDLLDRYNGQVPPSIDELLTLKGVGRKTANLVVALGHQLPAICVDIHVHRICNRLGYVQTTTPDETEAVLREKLPEAVWPLINRVMVLHGRAICRPIGPHCNQCTIKPHCQQVDVTPRKGKL
jgi:endonuclease III